MQENRSSFDLSSLDGLESYGWADPRSSTIINAADNMECDNLFGIHPFYIEKGIFLALLCIFYYYLRGEIFPYRVLTHGSGSGTNCIDAEGFQFLAPTTQKNTMRVLRAMQLNKPGMSFVCLCSCARVNVHRLNNY